MLIPAVLMSASEPFRESSLVISGMNKGEASRYPLLELDSYFGLLRLAPPRSQCARTCRTWQRQSRGLSRSAVRGLACLAIELIASRMTAVGRRTNLSRSTMILQLPTCYASELPMRASSIKQTVGWRRSIAPHN